MKTNTILAFLVAGALSLSSCSNKVDEKTIADINQFGTEWTALGEKATNWSNELTQTANKAKEFATQQTAMMNSVATSKDEALKTKVNEMAQKANQDATTFETMQNDFNTFKGTWDETSKQFSEWKDNVLKGTINPEQATKDLVDFKTKMSDAQARVDGWNNQYAEAKSSCEQNMAMAETIAAPAKK